MKTTLKALSALAIAAATLTAVTLASGSAASANPFRGGGHGPVVLHKVPLFAGRFTVVSGVDGFALSKNETGPVGVAPVLLATVAQQVHRQRLVIELLVVERDAHPERRRAAKVAV